LPLNKRTKGKTSKVKHCHKSYMITCVCKAPSTELHWPTTKKYSS